MPRRPDTSSGQARWHTRYAGTDSPNQGLSDTAAPIRGYLTYLTLWAASIWGYLAYLTQWAASIQGYLTYLTQWAASIRDYLTGHVYSLRTQILMPCTFLALHVVHLRAISQPLPLLGLKGISGPSPHFSTHRPSTVLPCDHTIPPCGDTIPLLCPLFPAPLCHSPSYTSPLLYTKHPVPLRSPKFQCPVYSPLSSSESPAMLSRDQWPCHQG